MALEYKFDSGEDNFSVNPNSQNVLNLFFSASTDLFFVKLFASGKRLHCIVDK